MIWSAVTVSVLGRAYLGVSLLVFILGLIWFTLVLQENRAWIEVVLLVPSLDFVDPLPEKRFRMNVAAIMAGWGGCVSLLLLAAIYAPFRIRSMALLRISLLLATGRPSSETATQPASRRSPYSDRSSPFEPRVMAPIG